MSAHNKGARFGISLPLHLVSEANARDHHMVKARRVKEQRWIVEQFIKDRLHRALRQRPGDIGWIVLLVRLAPRALDSDNLVSSLKAVRDGVADAFGVNDRDPRLEFRYDQRKSAAADNVISGYGCEIRCWERA
jgi:hypothetical protein